MVKSRRALLSSGLIGAVVLAAPFAGHAGAWSQRPVKFIVPFGSGAGADIGARVFAERLQSLWGQRVIVENRPCGDSMVAITAFMLRSQVAAGRVRLIVVSNATRAPFAPDVPAAREAGYPSLEVEGLIGPFSITALASELKEKIAADKKVVSGARVITERLKATGQVVN